MTFLLKVCFYLFSFVSVAEWPPDGKQLLTRLTIIMFSHMLTICNISYFRFGFKGWVLILIATV